MPELPEVEICRRNLAGWTRDRQIVRAEVLDPQVVRTRLSTRPSDGDPALAAALVAELAGSRPAKPIRHGKRLGWAFDTPGGPRRLLVHLGMSGNWGLRDEPPQYGKLVLHLDDGNALWFVDYRRFGCLVPVADLEGAMAEGLGPDALTTSLSGAMLAGIFRGSRAVKVALMDQAKLAGLGNIHAAEACFRARVHPGRACRDLAAADWDRLAVVIPEQLARAIDEQGGGELQYVEQGGDNPFAVYGHEGEPCPRCAATVVREKMGGRSTFWCPSCQPE